MSFHVSRIVWFGNGYGVEFIIADPYSITFNIITEKDPTLHTSTNVCVGTDSCTRNEGESLRDFAVRVREEGFSFAEEMTIEHKESLDLSTILGDVLGGDSTGNGQKRNG